MQTRDQTRQEREMDLWMRVYEQAATLDVGSDKADEALKTFRAAFPEDNVLKIASMYHDMGPARRREVEMALAQIREPERFR